MSDLIQRLRKLHDESVERADMGTIFAEAADEIELLRKVLKPFADKAEEIDDGQEGCEDAHTTLQAGDFFNARAVLAR